MNMEALRHLQQPEPGKNLIQRENGRTGPTPPSRDPSTPPPAPPARGREKERTTAFPQKSMQRESPPPPPGRYAAPAIPPPAVPVRRPILLARPLPHAP
jgi:hypothetical protein